MILLRAVSCLTGSPQHLFSLHQNMADQSLSITNGTERVFTTRTVSIEFRTNPKSLCEPVRRMELVSRVLFRRS